MDNFPIYSPEERISHPILTEKQISLTIKRDDMIHPFISGNKWRKLKYNVDEMLRQGKDHVVTFGGVWSNHLLATACAAAKFQLKATAFVRGEDVDSDSLFMYRMFGMNIIFVDRTSYRNKKALFDKHFGNDAKAYFVNEGGSGILGSLGCAEIVEELAHSYDHIFTAAGTGTTAAGILKGIIAHQPQAQLHVVPVLKGAGFIGEEIKTITGTDTPFYLHLDYHFGGYAKHNQDLLAFVKDFCTNTGILIDQVYTGKMLFGLFDLIKKDIFPRGAKICAIHTGGIFGLLGIKPELRTLLNPIDKQE